MYIILNSASKFTSNFLFSRICNGSCAVLVGHGVIVCLWGRIDLSLSDRGKSNSLLMTALSRSASWLSCCVRGRCTHACRDVGINERWGRAIDHAKSISQWSYCRLTRYCRSAQPQHQLWLSLTRRLDCFLNNFYCQTVRAAAALLTMIESIRIVLVL